MLPRSAGSLPKPSHGSSIKNPGDPGNRTPPSNIKSEHSPTLPRPTKHIRIQKSQSRNLYLKSKYELGQSHHPGRGHDPSRIPRFPMRNATEPIAGPERPAHHRPVGLDNRLLRRDLASHIPRDHAVSRASYNSPHIRAHAHVAGLSKPGGSEPGTIHLECGVYLFSSADILRHDAATLCLRWSRPLFYFPPCGAGQACYDGRLSLGPASELRGDFAYGAGQCRVVFEMGCDACVLGCGGDFVEAEGVWVGCCSCVLCAWVLGDDG